MASWMVHLRIADKLLDRIPGLSPIEFIMGNMAPDSGVPNENWSAFSPSTAVSHFRTDDGTGKKEIQLGTYRNRYFSPELRAGYNERQYAFYLGYYIHLLTDRLWSDEIAYPAVKKFGKENMAQIKENWYALDFLYLRNRPGFRSFRAYLGSVGFVNTYLDFFAPDAFDNRREYITSFYLQEKEIQEDFPYLTEAEADRFVDDAAAEILARLEEIL